MSKTDQSTSQPRKVVLEIDESDDGITINLKGLAAVKRLRDLAAALCCCAPAGAASSCCGPSTGTPGA